MIVLIMNGEKYLFLKNYLKSYDSKLLVVTKNQNIESIDELILLGQKEFGENRVQEAKNKFEKTKNVKIHLIGRLQTNKVKEALNCFDVIQSIDRERLVLEIIKHHNHNSRTKEFYIQINIGEESQKGGIYPDNIKSFYDFCIDKKMNIIGLMCIPPKQNVEKYFEKMVAIKKQLNHKLLLSMGMSNDFKIALKYESNLIRIGSYIFD